MQGNTHIRLGRMLADAFGITGIERAAFLYGNIQPDLAVPSHLSEQTGHRMDGHNFGTASARVMALFYRLRYGCEGTSDYFLLGKLCHYAADCFTWAHNENYPGTLSAHVSYEHRLDKLMRTKLLQPFFPEELESLSPPEFFFQAHKLYDKYKPGLDRDAFFIRMVTGQIVGGFVDKIEFLPECKVAGKTVRQIDSCI